MQVNKILESGSSGRPVKGRIMSRRKRLFALHTCQMGTLMASSRALDLDLLHSMTRKPLSPETIGNAPSASLKQDPIVATCQLCPTVGHWTHPEA